MNFKNKIETLINELEKNKFIEIEEKNIGPAMTKEDLMMILQIGNLKKLPIQFMKLYQAITTFSISWICELNENEIPKYEETDVNIRGKIDIFSPMTFMAKPGFLYSDIFTGTMDADDLNEIENFRTFDFNDDYIHYGLFVKGETVESDLYYIEQEFGYAKPDMDLDVFFEKMFESRGMLGWQQELSTSSDFKFKDEFAHYIHHIFEQ